MNKLSAFRRLLKKRREKGKGKVVASSPLKDSPFRFLLLKTFNWKKTITHTTRDGLLCHLSFSAPPFFKGVSGSVRIIDDRKKIVSSFSFMQREAGTSESHFFIENAMTKPSYRKEGLFKETLSDLIDLAKERGEKRIRLNVERGNYRAIEAYKKLGFKQIKHLVRVGGKIVPMIQMELMVQ